MEDQLLAENFSVHCFTSEPCHIILWLDPHGLFLKEGEINLLILIYN